MKKLTSGLLAVFLLVVCMTAGAMEASAAKKTDQSRAIAIVFDNSGSMYEDNDNKPTEAWCRATYAMEVFASMLNKGDTLLIYPMWPFEVDGKEYTMENPLHITDSQQSSHIRSIYTPNPGATPIESIECAISGLKDFNGVKKYVIVLTDGDVFYRDGVNQRGKTKQMLDTIIQDTAGESMTVMYLGIGKAAVMPDTGESEYFVKKQAVNSEDVLSSLTEMCNKIFGRDTLPENHKSKKEFDFDISMSKLIVFAQGKGVSDVKVSDENGRVLKPVSKTETKYSTEGNGKYKNVYDDSLQGVMLTYENCPAGTYKFEYSGKEPRIEVYYEPDADLDFVFTDSEGNTVNPDALYEGEYMVSFGMKDAKTGELISSDLLGTPKYRGTYSINDETMPITHDGESGYESVNLKMNDAFDANLTVTYLSGYTISKNSTDFGWPFGGIKVAARPAGNMRLEISGGDNVYSLQDLTKGKPYIAKIFYEGNQITGEALMNAVLEWNPDTSNADITKEFADDHYKLWLGYKDSSNPQDTECGKCTVTIYATYHEEGSDDAMAQKSLSYVIRDDFTPLRLDLYAPDSYITIKELEESRPIVAGLSINGKPLSQEDFKAVNLRVDCENIEYEISPDDNNSSYLIKLLPTDGVEEGTYPIRVTAEYTDHIGRVTETEGSLSVTLSTMPLWLKWLIRILILLIVILIITLWLRTPVLPKKIRITNVSVKVGGKETPVLKAKVVYPSKGKRREIKIKGTGDFSDARWSAALVPAKDSYRYLPSKKRKAMVVNGSVKASGYVAKLDIGAESYARNKKDNKLYRTSESVNDFSFRQGAISYSGEKDIGGRATKYVITGDIKFD